MPEARIDGAVSAFTLAVSLFVGLIFGLAPVAAALRAELTDGLRSMKRIHLPSLLVTAEVALSLVLLAAAGLLMRVSSACGAWPPAFNPTRSPCFG